MRHRWLLALALVAPACLFPALDDLTASGQDGSGPDVSSSDVVVVDANDAAVDAPSLCPDASDASFCASLCPAPTFCDDFDLGNTFGRWSDGLISVNGNGTVQDGGVSPPHQASFTTKTFDAGTAFAEVRTQLGGASVVSVEGDFTVNTGEHFGVFVIEPTPLPPYLRTRLVLNVAGPKWELGQEIQFTDGGAANVTTPISANVPSSGWFHVAFTFDMVAHMATVVVDGVTIADKVPVSSAFVQGNYTIRTGIYAVSAPAGFQKVLVDNVVVHAQ